MPRSISQMTLRDGEDVIKGNTHHLLVEMQTCTATMENNMVVHQKARNRTTSRYNYTPLVHIPKGRFILKFAQTC